MSKKKETRSERFNQEHSVIDIEEARKKRRERRDKKNKIGKAFDKVERSADAIPGKEKLKKNRRRVLIAAVVIAALILCCFSVTRMAGLIKEKKRLETANQQLEQRIDSKKDELKNVNDPEYIEKQARKLLNMVYPDEIIYISPDEENK